MTQQPWPAGEGNVQAALQPEMGPGEALLWTGQPMSGRYRAASIAVMAFGILFTGFALLWTAMATGGGALIFGLAARGPGGAIGMCMGLFGLPFIAVGIGMLLAPVWMPRQARRTFYGLTNQRAIVLTQTLFGRRVVQSFGPAQAAGMTRYERPDGSGNLIFNQQQWRDSDGGGHVRNEGFMYIPNVRGVEDLVRATLLRQETQAS